ncbi:MAG: hypothetical protein L6R38_000144 [Xanthoria sp. 2 TBL-2021]|nr:MAG: hypothetical protein L6R38_000144 [Xanthoria sp. 2 TBL-2021]
MDHGPLGFVFTDYESYRPVPNIRVDQVLQQAITAVAAALKRDPSLEYRPLTGEGAAKSTLPVDEINLYIEPRFPYMTLGNLLNNKDEEKEYVIREAGAFGRRTQVRFTCSCADFAGAVWF